MPIVAALDLGSNTVKMTVAEVSAPAGLRVLYERAEVTRIGEGLDKNGYLLDTAQARTLAELVKLPGVGRKTANVVMGVTWGMPEGVVVDTHVQRLSQRLGLTKKTEPEDIEQALCKLFPRELWDPLSHTLIFHGRRVCFAQKPACSACGVSTLCPNAFKAENVGRKQR